MDNKIIRYLFIVLVIILIIVAVWQMRKNTNEIENETLDQSSTVSTIQDDLRFAICSFDTLNPITTNNRNVQQISKIIYEPLVTLNQNYKLEYCLAEEIAKIDDVNFIIKLRKNVKWHDGTEFTFEDVKFTVDILKQGGINSIYLSNVQAISALEKIDNYALKITLAYPVEFFEYNLTFPILCVSDFDREGNSANQKNQFLVGTGKFKVDSIDANVIKLSKNNNYWDNSKIPMSKEISVNLYNSSSEMYNAFKNGEIDILDVRIDDIEKYIGSIGYKKIEYKSRDYDFLAINTRNSFLSDPAVRKAMSKIIDKNNIVATCLGGGYVTSNFSLDMGKWLYTRDLNVEANSTEAGMILENAGWVYQNNKWLKEIDGRVTELTFSISVNGNDATRIRVAENISNQFKNLGIKVPVKQLTNEAYSSAINSRNFDMIITGITCSFSPDVSLFFGDNNLANYSNGEVGNIMQTIKNSFDENLLYENYDKLYNIYLEEVPYIGLYRNTNIVACNQGLVGNIQANAFNIYFNVEKWYRQ